MIEIILSTTNAAAEGETELVALGIVTQESDWSGVYNRLQIFRSTQGDGGPFEELTAASFQRPRLPIDGGDQPASPVAGALVNIVGTTLDVEIGMPDITVTVTFTGSDPLTYEQVAGQITAQGQGFITSYVDADGDVVIEGTYPGSLSRIRIPESEGAVRLGLPVTEPDNTAQGKGARPSLIPGQTRYIYNDGFGSRDYFYRTRFLNAQSQVQSDFSISYSASKGLGLEPENVILGYALLVSNSGEAFQGGEVRVYTEFDGLLNAGHVVAGGDVIKYADENGRVEFQLVRGHKVTFAIQGTSIVRTITVPTDPSLQSFNLLDPAISDDDIFKAVVPEIITAERRSL